MGHFLDVAHIVLKENGGPLDVKEITNLGIEKKILKTKGATPSQTMKSKLSTDILRKKENSLFMRTEQGLFALREWEGHLIEEYIADRFQKTLLDETIAVFPIKSLNKYINGPGFHPKILTNSRELLAECRPISRIKAENDFSVIQLVSVFVVKFQGKILTYKRTKRLPEKRLHNFYSIAFGGHINYSETIGLYDIFDPSFSGVVARELKEELRLTSYSAHSIEYSGLIYDDRYSISKQHLGIVFYFNLDSSDYEIGERGFLIDPKFETIEEIGNRIEEFENWSELLYQYEISKY